MYIALIRLLTLVVVLLLGWPNTQAVGVRALLVEARNLAYDANYRNDAASLRAAIDALQPLASRTGEAAYAHYYLSWAYWALSASQLQDKDTRGGLESGRHAVEEARAALALREKDPEFLTALVNALIVVAILDKTDLDKALPEILDLRRKAVELGPRSPRVTLMDAGILFYSPSDRGGNMERGVARCEEALRLFDEEANATAADPLAPRWGHAMTYASLASMYLRMTPARKDLARAAAETALRMRPDFWYVREQQLPMTR